jgi:hypothetical protein
MFFGFDDMALTFLRQIDSPTGTQLILNPSYPPFGAFVAFRHVCRETAGEGQHLAGFARNVCAEIPGVGAGEESAARDLDHLCPPCFLRGDRCLEPRPIALA